MKKILSVTGLLSLLLLSVPFVEPQFIFPVVMLSGGVLIGSMIYFLDSASRLNESKINLIKSQNYFISKDYSIKFLMRNSQETPLSIRIIIKEWREDISKKGITLPGMFFVKEESQQGIFEGKIWFPQPKDKYDGPKGKQEIDALNSLALRIKKKTGITGFSLSYCDEDWNI